MIYLSSVLLTSIIPSGSVLIKKDNRILKILKYDRCPIRVKVGTQKEVIL